MRAIVARGALTLATVLLIALPAYAQEAVVRAVLFYSPGCSHCKKVITEDIPPLVEKYGDRLEIIGIDVTQPGGQALYQSAIQRFSIPEDRLGVPTLIVGDRVLVGSGEIPAVFPGLIEQGLAQGGIDWPDIPGLREALPPTPTPSASEAAPAPIGAVTPVPVSSGFILDNLRRDPLGNGLSVAVLLGMIASLVTVGARTARRAAASFSPRLPLAAPLLALVGVLVAGYLTYVESSGDTAFCGPVGDCNAVQQSPYARLFGTIPIGGVGLVGYVGVLVAWAIAQTVEGPLAGWARVAAFALAVVGTLASAYLTFLEPFVIGATCMWCLTSAALMTALLWLSHGPASASLARLRAQEVKPASP